MILSVMTCKVHRCLDVHGNPHAPSPSVERLDPKKPVLLPLRSGDFPDTKVTSTTYDFGFDGKKAHDRFEGNETTRCAFQ